MIDLAGIGQALSVWALPVVTAITLHEEPASRLKSTPETEASTISWKTTAIARRCGSNPWRSLYASTRSPPAEAQTWRIAAPRPAASTSSRES